MTTAVAGRSGLRSWPERPAWETGWACREGGEIIRAFCHRARMEPSGKALPFNDGPEGLRA